MATININPATFIATTDIITETRGDYTFSFENGTIEVTIGSRTFRANARRYTDKPGRVHVFGFVGRYRTSNKAWRASVTADEKGVSGWFGRDDRSGRFNKMQGISYEPETYKAAR